MIRNQFILRTKTPYSNIEIIVCKERRLEIEVQPNQRRHEKPGDLTLVMEWEQGDRVFFHLLGEQPVCTIEVLNDAVYWYVTTQLKREYTNLQLTEYIKRNFWVDDEDGFEQMPPESEEDRAFRLHISDEQRKHDVSLKVEALLKQNPFMQGHSGGI